MKILKKSLFVLFLIVAGAYLWPKPDPVSHVYFEGVDEPEVIAHGGGLGVRPANTLAALQQATVDQADVLEIDLQLTKDGELVLLHDSTLDRTTDLSGPVEEMTVEEVKKANAGKWDTPSGDNFADLAIRIPTIDEAFTEFGHKRWVIEIKNEGENGAIALCQKIRQFEMSQKVLAASFHDDAIQTFRAVCPEVATSSSSGETTLFVVAAKLGVSHLIPMGAVAMQLPPNSSGLEILEPRVIQAAKDRGLKIHAWTINEKEEMERLLALGVDGVITDFVERGRSVSGL
ncbi:glycerophosphodiester phosphodiesterase [uncultured Endozoicomonas sp.]|uniref:glycerophosphodiester phosphodiesterase n=1 Tax=uncultured Endozoicomonas sp. TaxID=432652 RepID=UPI00260F49A8|nr:glycerophosphodiester phosphodiesterase [uncultured Endozoicomonas sp.]